MEAGCSHGLQLIERAGRARGAITGLRPRSTMLMRHAHGATWVLPCVGLYAVDGIHT